MPARGCEERFVGGSGGGGRGVRERERVSERERERGEGVVRVDGERGRWLVGGRRGQCKWGYLVLVIGGGDWR